MMKEPKLQEQASLSDEVAQRLLARVVELDAHRQSGTSIQRLREVTRELGIPDATFDRALQERSWSQPSGSADVATASGSLGRIQRWWLRIVGAPSGRTLAEDLLVNAGVFAVFYGTLGVASRFSRLVGGDWELRAGLFVVLNVAAVAVARRYRARPIAFVLATTAVAQAVEYAMHLAFGIRAVQGGPTHLAVLLAVGVTLLGAPLLRAPGEAGPTPSPHDGEAASTPEPKSARPWHRWWSRLADWQPDWRKKLPAPILR